MNIATIGRTGSYKSTAKQVLRGIDLTGKTAVVTGGYSGVGLETVRALVDVGAKVVVPARRVDIAQKALAHLQNVEIAPLDLMNPDSIASFSEKFLNRYPSLDILIESAGIMYPPLRRDARGIESQFATNHLGHFQLTLELLPALKQAKNGARVIVVSSRAQRDNGILWDDWNFEKTDYLAKAAYSQSKTANILFVKALDKRVKAFNIRAFSVHPGLIPTTHIGREMDTKAPFFMQYDWGTHLINFLLGLPKGFNREKWDYYKTAKQGAATQVFAATSEALNELGGLFLEDVQISVPVSADSTSRFGVRPWAIDEEEAEKLWALSEKCTGIYFTH